MSEFKSAKDIAMQLFPDDWKSSDDGSFRVDNNAGKRAVAVDVAQYFINLNEGCIHNHGLGLCDECLSEVDKF